MEDYRLFKDKGTFNNKIFCNCKYKYDHNDYTELLDNMELEAEERVEFEDINKKEMDEVFPEDKNVAALKTAEDWYFTYVLSKYDVLPKDEQLRLLNVYHTTHNPKDKEKALDTLLETNQRLIVGIAKKYKNIGVSVDLDDLIQEGNLGLMKAIEKYDISVDTALSTYAIYWIRVYMGRYIQEQGNQIRVSVNMLKKIYKFRRIISALQRKGEKIPSHAELAKLMGCSSNQLTRVICYSNLIETVSLSTPVKGRKLDSIGEGIEIQDFIPAPNNIPSNECEKAETVKCIHQEMRKMFDERTYDILCRRYGMNEYLEPQTLEQIGLLYGISKERVRQIQDKAEKQIFNSEKIKLLIK